MKVYWLKIVEITKKSESEDSKIVSQVWNIPPPTNEFFLNLLLKKKKLMKMISKWLRKLTYWKRKE
jgi:hypothetical protein